jgi:hypothetical protein
MNKILVTLLFLFSLDCYAGEVVYRCVPATGGATVYQSTPCGKNSEVVKIRKEDQARLLLRAMEREALVSPVSSFIPVQTPRQPDPQSQSAISTSPAPSFKCLTADGKVFYRHDACPAASPVVVVTDVQTRRGIRQVKTVDYVPVSSAPVSQEEACREIRKTSRSSKMDQKYSSYDRNLGRDPCR